MENSQKTTAEHVNESAKIHESDPSGSGTLRKKAFLSKYDEVLNTCILSVFRKTLEEFDRTPDHRAVKIINGEVVYLRLDSLHGQADGIRIFLDREQLPMYIWFAPDILTGKIAFKLLYGEKEKKERYDLSEITSEFLINLIAKKFILKKRYSLN
jgi:hypothetical protein